MDIYLRPNWTGGVLETQEFRTTIFTTDDGHEQRSAERINPRRSLEFESTLRGDALRHVKASLSSRQNYLCQLPEPILVSAEVVAFAPAGSTQLTLSKAIPATRIGRRICVHTHDAFIFGEIQSVDGPNKRITLTAPTQLGMPVGASVRLCIPGRLPAAVTMPYSTDDEAEVKVTFSQDPGMARAAEASSVQPVTFGGREVLIAKPDWSKAPSVEIITPYEELDYGRGVTRAYASITFPTRITEFNFTGQRAGDIGYLTDFFARHMGRLHEFWCPSWVSDLRLVQPIVSGTSSVVVAGRRTGDLYSSRRVDRAAAIRLVNGSMRYFNVSAIETDGTNTILTTPNPLNFNVPVDEHLGFYWLNVCRFAADTMTVHWMNDQIGQTVLNITTLEALAVDTL